MARQASPQSDLNFLANCIRIKWLALHALDDLGDIKILLVGLRRANNSRYSRPINRSKLTLGYCPNHLRIYPIRLISPSGDCD